MGSREYTQRVCPTWVCNANYNQGLFARFCVTPISEELATFIGIPVGVMIARPDVTRALTKYILDNNLRNEQNKRIIDLNKPGGQALKEVLRVPDNEELTFFNLQKYLKIHFEPPLAVRV